MRVFDKQTLESACQWLNDGQLLAYPTEAVWGIGCDPFNEQAVEQILAIKNRPIEKGMIVITADSELINDFFQPLPSTAQQNIRKTWQNSHNQATTFLFPIPPQIDIPHWVTGGRDTLAIRVINHPMIAELCQIIAKTNPNNPYGFLISTSCNPTGNLPATTFEQAVSYFGQDIGYLLGDTLGYTQPSQIRDALINKVLRD